MKPQFNLLVDRLMFLRLLRHAGTGVVLALVAIGLLGSALPALGAASTGWLLSNLDGNFLAPLIAVGAALLIDHVTSIVFTRTGIVVVSRIDMAHRIEVATLATGTATVDTIEQQDIQNLFTVAAADLGEWVEKTPGQGAVAALRILLQYCGLVASAVVVSAWSPWLVPALLIPALAARWMSIQLWKRRFRLFVDGISHFHRYRYWGELPINRAEANEVRVFGLTDWAVGNHQEELHRHLDPMWAHDRRTVAALMLEVVLSALPLAGVFCAVGYITAVQGSAVGVATAALAAGWGFFSAVTMASEVVNLEGSRPSLRALAELRERLRPDEDEPDATAPRSEGPPLVRFTDVQFAYDGRTPVMKGLNLEIRPGETLAVVGFNGAGKSTLIKLLAGVYRPSGGSITADGNDIARLGQWSAGLAIVFQDFVKYHLTVAENISLGYPGEPDPESTHKAIEGAGLAPVVAGLDAGVDTPLAPSRTGGTDLSGGQWQQVALARALYSIACGATILVLDEPTAHLDVRTEKELFDRLEGLTDGITTILVSHRLSTVRQADRIVLLADGQVAESGTHAELMDLEGTYAHMYKLQANRYKARFHDRLEEGELR